MYIYIYIYIYIYGAHRCDARRDFPRRRPPPSFSASEPDRYIYIYIYLERESSPLRGPTRLPAPSAAALVLGL